MFGRVATRVRWGLVAILAALVVGVCLQAVHAQPSFRPPGPIGPRFGPPNNPGMPGAPFGPRPNPFAPNMPGASGPLFERVWTCGGCGKEIGNGAFPPSQCPFCGARMINGIGPAQPGAGNGAPNPGMMPPGGMVPPTPNPMMPNFPNMPAPEQQMPNDPKQPNFGPVEQAPLETVPQIGQNNPAPVEDVSNLASSPSRRGLTIGLLARIMLGIAALLAAVVLIVVGIIVVCMLNAKKSQPPEGRKRRRRFVEEY